MKSLLLTALLSLSVISFASAATQTHSSVVAKKGKSEPAPKEEGRGGNEEAPLPQEGTYEGNERGGGSFDGGGYEGDGGGMGGELFYKNTKTYPVTTTTKTEDRGDVVVHTTTVQEDISASETCTTVTVTLVAKSTGRVISSDSNEFCNRWPL